MCQDTLGFTKKSGFVAKKKYLEGMVMAQQEELNSWRGEGFPSQNDKPGTPRDGF